MSIRVHRAARNLERHEQFAYRRLLFSFVFFFIKKGEDDSVLQQCRRARAVNKRRRVRVCVCACGSNGQVPASERYGNAPLHGRLRSFCAVPLMAKRLAPFRIVRQGRLEPQHPLRIACRRKEIGQNYTEETSFLSRARDPKPLAKSYFFFL